MVMWWQQVNGKIAHQINDKQKFERAKLQKKTIVYAISFQVCFILMNFMNPTKRHMKQLQLTNVHK